MRAPLAALVLVVASIASAVPVRADEACASLLHRLAAANPELRTYRADVAFEVGLRSFPYVRKTLHGNAFFKRPARMQLVFRDLPSYAKNWSNLYVGLGTPTDWERKFTLASAVDPATRESYLVLTPRVAERRLREVDLYVDPGANLPNRIVWAYRDGRIEMRQRFERIDGHDLIVTQEADIRFPAFHAFVNTRITNYALNVEVEDRVFTERHGENAR